MKITEEAKVLIMKALASNNCDCLQVKLNQSCCGTSVSFSMAKLTTEEKPVSVNGVSVLMDKQGQARTDTVTLTTKNGKLSIQDDVPSC